MPGRRARQGTRAFAAGAVGYFVKPVVPETLIEKVKAQLAASRQWGTMARERAGSAAEGQGGASAAAMAIAGVEPIAGGAAAPAAPAAPGALRAPDDGIDRFRQFVESLVRSGVVPLQHRAAVAALAPRVLFTQLGRLGVDEAAVAKALAAFLGLDFKPSIAPEDVRIGILPTAFCIENMVIPVVDVGTDCVALANPFDWHVIEAVTRALGARWRERERLLVVPPSAIRSLAKPRPSGSGARGRVNGLPSLTEAERDMERAFAMADERSEDTVRATDVDEGSGPAIAYLNRLIETAVTAGATDIHVEPEQDHVDIRFRIDGQLRRVSSFRSASAGAALVSRVKVLCRLDIAERRLPQDGRMSISGYQGGRPIDIDLRVATAPTRFGEMLAMRILDRRRPNAGLEDLGFSEHNALLYRRAIRNPYGMIIHAGPTGAGKTSTLYAALGEIRSPAIKILTIEDPVEYAVPGVSQIQVQPEIGLDFARALRSFLRLDPDVILVGEMRDLETARTAVEAALTGHLLLATRHAQDAAATVLRLTEMGIEPVVVSSSVLLACAQRLIRRLCLECREPYEPGPRERALVGAIATEDLPLYNAVGCPQCNRTGYRGRIGIHEVLALDDELRNLAKERDTTAQELRRLAISKGMVTLFDDAMEKVRNGLVSLAEALTAVVPDSAEARAESVGLRLTQDAAIAA
ncbi:MAG: type II/IV secretion system protein [Deltaproteobacteria bacterium]|nr:type II/IV secretion system protein [Deltaproteobacteria bacterium]